MPTRRPRRSKRAPPELPGLIGASIWIIGTPSRFVRPTALTTPAVTVSARPKGLPIANTRSPCRRPPSGSSASSAPCGTAPSGRRIARSWRGSASRTSAGTSRPSLVTTLTDPPASMTWLLVTIRPDGSRITPLPWLPAVVRTCTTVERTRATTLARSASAPSAGGVEGVAVGVSAASVGVASSSLTTPPTSAPVPPASARAATPAATRPSRRRDTRRRGTTAGRSASATAPRPDSGGSGPAGGGGSSGGSPGPRSGRDASGGSPSARGRGSRGGRPELTT